MSAKWEERRIRLYEMDLLWLDVKRHYKTEPPKPSDIAERKNLKDTRTAEEIRRDVIKMFS